MLTDLSKFPAPWFGGKQHAARNGAEDDDGPAHQQDRERLWLSPHCLREPVYAGLFDEAGE